MKKKIEDAVREYFAGLKTPPADDDFHAWAEREGLDTHAAEAGAYAVLHGMMHPPKVDEKAEGKKVEREHADLVKKIRADIEKDGKLDMTDDQVFSVIADAHIAEDGDYYAKLLALVEKKNGEKGKGKMVKSFEGTAAARRRARELYQGAGK